jgi:prepilin-type N-terminal cleavage/methylation domain-containing protein
MKNTKKGFTICHPELVSGSCCFLKGFTLIELLVVVLIIGILAAVALPQYKKTVAKSRLATLKNIVETITQAAEVYYMANNTYPDTFDQMDVDIPTPTELSASGNSVTYTWGHCQLDKTSTDAKVYCENTQEEILYLHRFAYISNGLANQRRCRGCNPIANAVCKQDTGQNSPDDDLGICQAYAYK